MKISMRLSFAGLFVLCFFLSASPAPAFSDNMPHIGQTSACAAHLPNLTHVGANYTFRLCVGTSQATTWSWTVVRKSDGLVLPCSIADQPVTVNTLQCTGIPSGQYSVTVAYKVGTSPGPTHADCWYLAP
jgi:hypothetical protein